jgi:hypothetical protein
MPAGKWPSSFNLTVGERTMLMGVYMVDIAKD